MLWDLYCRVIDNQGDLGVCWRLARDLASRGETVQLFVDDASALRWMAPHPDPLCSGESEPVVLAFDDVSRAPGDVVIEMFGCDPPAEIVARMHRAAPPVWINLEHLSAEPYVERCHALASPRPDGLRKWFYYPGFTDRTGGLIREARLLAARSAFDRDAWLAAHGWPRRSDERVVTLFCYPNPALPALLDALGAAPTLLLATAGHAAAQVAAGRPHALRAVALPWVPQCDFDRLLWSSDLNVVRGEDSLVRAIWAGAPFVWQAYPQHDGAHRAKVDALLDLFLEGARPALAHDVRALWRAWNGFADWPAAWPDRSAWRAQAARWRSKLLAQADLGSRLLEFVADRRS